MQLLQSYIDGIINNALEEDIHYVDVTTDYLIPDGHTSKAYYIAKDEGVLCGIEAYINAIWGQNANSRTVGPDAMGR